MITTKNELSETVAQKRNMLLDLFKSGLLFDENGNMSNTIRTKVLDMLGFGIWENVLDTNSLQVECARRENIAFSNGESDIEVCEIHDHDLHIQTHTNFMLSKDFETLCKKIPEIKDRMIEHIRNHKQFKKLNNEIEGE